MIATIWEVWNDYDGDKNKPGDVWMRAFLLWIEAVALHLITNGNILLAFNLSIAFFFLIFDYTINYVLIKNGTLEPPRGVRYHWFSYSGKSGVIDNLKFWRNMNPWVKLIIRMCYFILSLILYFKV